MLSSKTKKKLKSLAKLFNPSGNFKKYRALPMGYPCIRFMRKYKIILFLKIVYIDFIFL